MKAHRLVIVLLVLIPSVGLVLLDRGDVEDARDSVLAHPSTSELRQQWLDQRYGELGDVERAQSLLAVIERRTGRAPRTKQVRLSGTWTERGSSNVAGRVVDVGFNAATGRLYLLSAGGTLWSASWSRLDWTPINDSMRVYGARQVLVGSGDTPTVVATGTDSPRNVLSVRESSPYFSTGAGNLLSGPIPIDATAEAQLAIRLDADCPPAGGLCSPVAQVVYSRDGGVVFRPVGLPGRLPLDSYASQSTVAMWHPPDNSGDIYVVASRRVYRLQVSGSAISRADLGTINTERIESAGFSQLAGHRTTTGTRLVYAFAQPNGFTQIVMSDDGGLLWRNRGDVSPDSLALRFDPCPTKQQLAISLSNPNTFFFGKINLHRSVDAGLTWTPVNNWQNYELDPSQNLHADVCAIRPTIRDSIEVLLVATDGGLYESVNNGTTVRNLTLAGLRNAQYYSSFSADNNGGAFVGSQDQGLQGLPPGPVQLSTPFSRLPGGAEYNYLGSANQGRLLWGAYPFWVLALSTVRTGELRDAVPKYWSFSSAGVYASQFYPPLAVATDRPDVSYVAVASANQGVHRIYELTAQSSSIAHRSLPRDFPGQVTAISTSRAAPSRILVATTTQSTGRKVSRLHVSNDRGGTWSDHDLPAALAGEAFINTIEPHPIMRDTVLIGLNGQPQGSSPVLITTDAGTSFLALGGGLPRLAIGDLSYDSFGNHLFSATSVGAYYFDLPRDLWIDITSPPAPDQIYTGVEVLDQSRIARFTTYGRGLWDFTFGSVIEDHPADFDLTGAWYDVATPGQGFLIEELDNNRVLAWWFSFFPGGSQFWIGGLGTRTVSGAEVQTTFATGGRFPPNFSSATIQRTPSTTLSFSFDACDRGRVLFQSPTGQGAIEQRLTRLTRPLGVPCRGATPPSASISVPFATGTWFDPSQSGHGLFLQRLESDQLLAWWFTFAPHGGLAWFGGVGPIVGSRAVIPVNRTIGGEPPPDHNPDDVQNVPFGSLIVEFTSCDSARISYDLLQGFGRGELPLVRISRPRSVRCPQ